MSSRRAAKSIGAAPWPRSHCANALYGVRAKPARRIRDFQQVNSTDRWSPTSIPAHGCDGHSLPGPPTPASFRTAERIPGGCVVRDADEGSPASTAGGSGSLRAAELRDLRERYLLR
jgi:hypothetical protein